MSEEAFVGGAGGVAEAELGVGISRELGETGAQLVVSTIPQIEKSGAPVTSYRVEWWTYQAYGLPEVQVVKIPLTSTGGTFTLTLDPGQVTGPLSATALYSEMEAALEGLDGAGDVTVTQVQSAASQDYTITFNSRIGAVPIISVDTTLLIPAAAQFAVVCARGAAAAATHGIQCLAAESRTSTVNTVNVQASSDFPVPDTASSSDPYTYLISGLTQQASTVPPTTPGQVGGANGPGFQVRVLAKNSAGYGLPSATVALKPMDVPAAPQNVALRLVAGSSTSLRIWWDPPATNNAAVVSNYVVEWSPVEDPFVPASLFDMGSSFRQIPGYFLPALPTSQRFNYTVDALVPGVTYQVQVSAENVMGVGPIGHPVPSVEMPRSKPEPLVEGVGGGVALSVMPASSSISTLASSTSLLLSWLPVAVADAHGASVTNYVVDWFQPQSPNTSPFEVQMIQIFGQSSTDIVEGSFRVQYSGSYTEPLPADVSEAELEDNLEALPTLRSVEVERTAVPSRGGYTWAITFLSEAPALLGKILAVDSTNLQAAGLAVDVGAQLSTPHIGSSSVTVAAVQGSAQVTSTDSGALAAQTGMYLAVSQTGVVTGLWRVAGVVVATISNVPTATLTLSVSFPAASGNYPAQLGSTVPGVQPNDYHSTVVPALTAVQQTYSLVLDSLPPGVSYSARVSACNSLGCNAPTMATPLTLAAPKQKPAAPLLVALFSDSASTLRVRWRHPTSDGGDVITHYRIEWDLKPTFNSGNSLTGETSTGSSLGYERKPVVTPGVDCLLTPCETVIGSLLRGTPYYVRVYAYNTFGYSLEAGYPVVPGFGVPMTMADPPAQVLLEPIEPSLDRGIAVKFNTSSASYDDGGADVTQYQIEWDAMDIDAVIPDVVDGITKGKSAAVISTLLIGRVLFAQYTTQLILLSGTAYDIRGSFRLAFRDAVTANLPWDISSDDLTSALEALPTVGRVKIRRIAAGYGFAWLVSFWTAPFEADTSAGGAVYGDLPLIQVSVDNTQLLAAFSTSQPATATLTGTGAVLATSTIIRAFNGFEQQVVQASTTAGNLGGYFQLVYDQQQTALIPANASTTAVYHALLDLEGAELAIGDIQVYAQATVAPMGFVYTIVYLSRLGPNQPLVSCDGSALTKSVSNGAISCTTTRAQGGGLPTMNSPLYGVAVVNKTDLQIDLDGMARYEILGLRSGVGYHVRVSAWNGVGDIFGDTQASYPARFAVTSPPDSPRDVNVGPLSPTALLVSWTQPLSTGGSPISNYTVQVAARHGISEQQLIQAESSLGDLSIRQIALKVRLGDQAVSAVINGNASKDEVQSAIATALNAQDAIAGVSRTSLGPFSGYRYEWVVTFSDTLGDVPLIEATESSSALYSSPDYNSALTLTVSESVRGSIDGDSMTAANVSTVVAAPQHEVQRIFIYSGSPVDLGGSVLLSVGGESTPSLVVGSSDQDIRAALEGLSTVSEVSVTVTSDAIERSAFPATRNGVYWDVTFVGATTDLPLMGVRTDPTLRFTSSACGGTLTGITPCVEVTELVAGGLPSQVVLTQLDSATNYVARIAASNDAFVSSYTTIPGAFQPTARPPLEVRDALVSPLALDALGVIWRSPEYNGGARIVHYKVQWDVSANFDQQSIFSGSDIVLSGDEVSSYEYRITGLDSSQDYFVAVVAYNERGYGVPVTAQPVDARKRVTQIVIQAATLSESVLAAETVTLNFANYAAQTTSAIPVTASALEMQSALQRLPVVGVLSVSRSDYSNGPSATPYDTSGVSTSGPGGFLVVWTITFRTASIDGIRASALGLLSYTHIGSTSTVSISDIITPIQSTAMTVRPRGMSATGPVDVRVSIVDAASFGVSWLPSLSTITPATKYLVEWSATTDFASCRASSTSGGGSRTTYAIAAANSDVIPQTSVGANGRVSYTIGSLSTGTQYYVRVSAFNGNYGSPVLAQVVTVHNPSTADGVADIAIAVSVKNLAPQAQTPYRPTTVTMQVSSEDQPTQLEVRFTEPTTDALGFTAGNGGAAITSYRLSWWDPSNALAVQTYDVRMVDGTGAATQCTPSACMFRLGAEVQYLALTATAVTGTGSYRLVLASSIFSQPLCVTTGTCSLSFATPTAVDYTGSAENLQLLLGTNAHFLVDAAVAACIFEVAAIATLQANKLPVRFVSAAGGATTCPLSTGLFTIHIEPTTSCILASANTAALKTAISGLLNGDVVDASLDVQTGNTNRYRITFTGSSASGASGNAAYPHIANVAQLKVVATDGTASCVAITGNVWTGTELNGGLVTPGVSYAVQVAALNSVGLGSPLRATALCHDMPCATTNTLLAPAAPPLAPVAVTVASNRADRTALNVVWNAPTSNDGSPVLRYLVEYSTADLSSVSPPSLCTGCGVALTSGSVSSPPTLTLNTNSFLLSQGQMVVLRSSPPCILTVSTDQVWYVVTGGQTVYNIQRQSGCNAFTGQTFNLDALYDATTTGSVLVSSGQSVTLTSLTPNLQYMVRVRAQNNEGFGAAVIATPICESGLDSCHILPKVVTMQLPAAPSLTVPSLLLGGGVPSNSLSFTANTLTIAFSDPNSWSGLEHVDIFRVEWDSSPDFASPSKQTAIITPSATKLPSLWLTRQLCPACITGLSSAAGTLSVGNSAGLTLGLGIGDWITVNTGVRLCQFQVTSPAVTASTINVAPGYGCSDFSAQAYSLDVRRTYVHKLSTGLAMGITTHIRVTAHNSLGYGARSDSVAVAPITSSDPPPVPDVVLAALTPDDENDPDVRVTSLRVLFTPPIAGLTDLNGNGGSPVKQYLVEWIDTTDFANMVPQIQSVSTVSASSGNVVGSFRLTLDTTTCTYCQIQGPFTTAAISASALDQDVAHELQNLPNIGNVNVARTCTTQNQCTWTITFLSELGVVPTLTYQSRLSSDDGGTASIVIAGSVQVGTLQFGNLPAATYCPTIDAGVPISGRTACGVVTVDPESTPVPYTFDILGLTTGNTYYARVAAYNALGYGARRVTAPTSLSVPYESPSAPRSPFNINAPPVLTLAGPTSLLVSFAAPEYSGGAPVTGYVIEWDTSPQFDNGANGDALFQDNCLVSNLVAGADGAFRYTITSLTTDQWVYVRMFAVNGNVGTRTPTLTQPPREMPREKPQAPPSVSVTNDPAAQPPGSGLLVSWTGSSHDVESYAIEWYRQAPTQPLFGSPVVQSVTTTGAITSGFFSLSFGDGSDLYPWRLLPGTVTVQHTDAFFQTSEDLTGLLARGDVVYIQGQPYLVASTGTFSATQLPLADATGFQSTGLLGSALGSTSTTYSGDTVLAGQLYTPWRTTPLPLDVTPSAMEEALEMLPSIGLVRVERLSAIAANNYQWMVTFTTQVPQTSPTFPLLTANDRLLVGTNANVAVTSVSSGQAPMAYGSVVISGKGDGGLKYSIPNLGMGLIYFVRVAAADERGVGGFTLATEGGSAPTRPPLALVSIAARALSPQLLELSFDQTQTSGGLPVDGYRVEASLTPQYSDPSIVQDVPPTTKFVRVTTSAYTGPFTTGSTFSLAAVNTRSFHGTLGVEINALGSTQALEAGAAFLLRMKPDLTHGYGGDALQDVISRGEHLRIRNEEVSVCLDGNVAWALKDSTTGLTSAGYVDTGTRQTITLSSALTGSLLTTIIAGTQLSVGAPANGPVHPDSCRAVVAAVSANKLSLDVVQSCVNPSVKLGAGRAIYVVTGVTSFTSTAYVAATSTTGTITLSPALTDRLIDVIVIDTRISVGTTPDDAASCRARVTGVVDATHLQVSHACAEVATKMGSGNPIFVHRGPAILPLCSRDDPWTPLNASDISTLVANLDASGGREPLPLFRSDSAVGLATNLGTLGATDMVLLKDPLTVNCGDYIRLGRVSGDDQDAEALEAAATFRVRGKCAGSTCDCISPAAANGLQLGGLDDPTTAASLTPSLDFAHGDVTREIQRIIIVVAGANVAYNTGGFRVSFGDEVSSLTLGTGGDGGLSLNDDVGCLVWASGPLSSDATRDVLTLERELENFAGIDDVRVRRALTVVTGSGAHVTVEYTVEFIGAQVRGDVQTLQVLDVGINGCSAFAGGATGTVQQDQNSFVTIYQAPTTPAIPFSATNEDVKAALETLSVVSNADVSRQVNKNGFDWRITFVEFPAPLKGMESSVFPALAANGYALEATQSPNIIVTPFQIIELPTSSLSGGGGVSIYARVRAHNDDGWGIASVPVPPSLQLAAQLPKAVRAARADRLSDSQILVQWDDPAHDGGEPVTEFRVEWWLDGTSSTAAKPFAVVHALEAASQSVTDDVATITVSAPTVGANTFLSGTFRVGFDGQWTPELLYDTSAVDMQSAIAALPTIEGVLVNRELTSGGFTWLVTFLQRKYGGDQQKRWRSNLATKPPFGYKLEVYGGNLLACTTAELTTCVPKLATTIASRAAVDSKPELQTLVCVLSGSVPTPGFKLKLMGVETTAVIPATATAQNLQDAIVGLGVVGMVNVRFRDTTQTQVCSSNSAALGVSIEFTSQPGDVPPLVVTYPTGVVVTIKERRKGRAQLHVGRLPFAYVIDGLTPASTYHARVAPYNSVGFGPFQEATDSSGLLLVAIPPSAPRSVRVRAKTIQNSHGMLVVWIAPRSAASSTKQYRVEWDSGAGFSSQCGENIEKQLLVVSSVITHSWQQFMLLKSAGGAQLGCVLKTDTTGSTLLTSLSSSYSGATIAVQGDDSVTYDYGRTYIVKFPQALTSPALGYDVVENEATATSPVDIPLLYWDSTDTTCTGKPDLVAPQRSTYGPGLDDKRGQGRIDSSNNECSAALAGPLARQTITTAVAVANAVRPEILNLAAKSGIFEKYDLAAPALCESCAQKLTSVSASVSLLTVTSSLTSVLQGGDYFVLADTTTAAVSPSTLRCVLKAIAVASSSITVDPTDPGSGACELPATFEAKAWRISRFELRAHIIQDLVPGREYAVRVIASGDDSTGTLPTSGDSPAIATATTITA